MADNVQFQSTQLATPASGTTVSTDEAASGHLQRVKLAYSADGVDTHIPADGSGLLVNTGAHLDNVHDSMALTDQGLAVKAAIFGHNSGGAGSYEPVKVTPSGALTVEIDDGGGSITVDGTIAATQSGTWNVGITGGVSLPTGAATEYSLGLLGSNVATVTNGSNLRVGGFVDARQTGAWNVGIAGSVPVTDNGGSLTVDGTVAATQSGAWTVTANAGTGPFPVSDNGGSLTVDGTVGVSGTVTVDGSGVTQPVSGTVTVQDGGNTITVDNGGTFAVQAAQTGTWTVQPGNTANTTAWKVDASSVAVPVTDNSGSLTVDNAGTFAVQAAQSGSWSVALNAGTNGIGKLTANSGVDIGDVDVTSVVPGTGATNLGKAEDAGHTSGDVGVMALAVRKDTPAALAGTDADYAPLEVNDVGQLHVAEVGAATLANGQAAPTNSAATLVAARNGRRRLILLNYGTVTVYVGIATVTTGNGFALDPGASLTLETSALLQGITASGTGAVHYIEEY